MPTQPRDVTLRRTVEQVKHCVEEALSVIERSEDSRCALDDLQQAAQLLTERVIPTLKAAITPIAGASSRR